MPLVPVTPPDPLVTLDEAKAHLRVDADDQDAHISALVMAASAYIDGRDGYLNRAVAQQQWDLKIDPVWWVYDPPPLQSPWWQWYGWGYGWALKLPLPPLRSVDSVKYLDQNGVLQTYSSVNYEVHGVGTESEGALWLKQGSYWPILFYSPESLIVRFTAGYDTVPPPIKQAALLLVSHFFENRMAVGGLQPGSGSVPFGVDALLSPYRVWAA